MLFVIRTQVVRSHGSAYFCGENVYLHEQGKPVDMNGRIVCEPLEAEDGTRAFMDVHAGGVHNKVARSMTARVAGLKVGFFTHVVCRVKYETCMHASGVGEI